MKDIIQIKTELVEFQHDALIAFYNTYPRLIVNKLLLRLCEGCLRLFPPTLADFIVTPAMPNAERRAVVIRIHKREFPELWQFYTELPYGARAHVMLNIMNRHAQHAETDRSVLETAYWKRQPVEEEAAKSQVVDAPLPNSPALASGTVVPLHTEQSPNARPQATVATMPETAAEPAAPPPPPVDPLTALKIDL